MEANGLGLAVGRTLDPVAGTQGSLPDFQQRRGGWRRARPERRGSFTLQSSCGQSPQGPFPATPSSSSGLFLHPPTSQMGPDGQPPTPATCQLTTTEGSLEGTPSLKKNSLQCSSSSRISNLMLSPVS